jgi:hypothetical protein
MCGIIDVISKKSIKVWSVKKKNDEITWRKDKMGWTMSNEHWFESELNNWVVSLINNSFFIQEEIKKVRLDTNLSKISLDKLIGLLNISVWYKVFFKNNK